MEADALKGFTGSLNPKLVGGIEWTKPWVSDQMSLL